MNSTQTGTLAELAACNWLIEQGYEVFRNVCSTGPFDIVAVKPGETLYIDVKTASPRLDFGVVSLGSSKFSKSADRFPELNKRLLYYYKGQLAWRLGDLDTSHALPACSGQCAGSCVY